MRSGSNALTLTGSRQEATTLRDHAHSIGATFSRFEQACLDVGARLGEALPGLNDLAAKFDALSRALEGGGIGEASADLKAIANELAHAADELIEESRALTELVGLNQVIGMKILTLLSSIRTISALVFTLKIESAPLNQSGEDMTAFAENLHELADHARRALDEYQAAHTKLDGLLRAACEAQTVFQRSHRDGLASIASEIINSLGTVEERRRRTAIALSEVSGRTREIGERIGKCVIGLQIGDSTRQRVEHAHDALHLAADVLDGSLPRGIDEAFRGLSSDEREGVAACVCRLQNLQIDGALDEFDAEIRSISASLASIAEETDELARRGIAVFGSDDSGGGSFLEALEHKLVAAQTMVEDCQRARTVVDQASAAVVTTMADLRERTESLLNIVVDVSIIGTNALLKSTRLGDRGRGISLIAQELRSYGDQIGSGINSLPPALNRVVVFVERFKQVGGSLDSSRLSRLDSRMSAAIQIFRSSGKQMTTALAELGRESDVVRAMLNSAVAMLASHEDVGPSLRSVAVSVDEIATGLGEERAPPEVGPMLDRVLRPPYTMKSERKIHDAFTGFREKATVVKLVPTPDVADAFML